MSTADPPATSSTMLRRLVAVIAAVAVIWLLRAAGTVLLPLAFAVFLIGLFWPLQRRLQEHMPRSGAMLLTLGAFLVVTGLFGWALVESIDEVVERAPRYEEQMRSSVEQVRDRLGLPATFGGNVEQRVGDWAVSQSRRAAGLVGGVILVLGYFILGLLEVRDYRQKLEHTSREGGHRQWREPVHRIARDFQTYMVVQTGVALLTAVGVGLAAWIIGLEFALLWAVLTFLLNYIPTIGSVLGVFPPVLFALVQGGWTLGLLALVTIGGVEVVMGTLAGPRLEGNYLRLSPLVVLFAVAFWEWVWGIPGAFIGVPVTVGIVITCAHFESTRWIAILLADLDDTGEPQVAEPARPGGAGAGAAGAVAGPTG